MRTENEADRARFADLMVEIYAIAERRGYRIAREITYNGPSVGVTFIQATEPEEARILRETQASIRYQIRGWGE